MGLINQITSFYNKKRSTDFVLLAILGLLSFTWFEGDLLLSGGDFPFNFHPLQNFERYHSTWYDGVSTGLLNVQAIPQMVTFQSFLAVSDAIGLPLFAAQRIIFYFLFTAGGMSMYFLTTTILKGKERRAAGLTSALFYMLNPFSMVILWGVPAVLLFFYPIIPLVLALYIRGINSRKTVLYIILICFSTGVVFSAAYSVAAFALTTWILILSFFVFYTMFHRKDKETLFHALKFTILLFLCWSAVNSYWILPYTYNLRQISTGAAYQDSVSILQGMSSEAGLANAFRLFGYPVFDKKFMDIDAFYPYFPIYLNPIFIIISFSIPILAFSSLLISKREKFYILYFSTFSLAVLFFFKGAQPPLGEIYVWLVKNFSLMAVFRNPLDKFGSLLPVGYSFLLGYTLAKLYYLPRDFPELRKAIRASFFFLGLLLFVVFPFPFWTGQVFEKGGEVRPSWQVKVPDYYSDAASWLAGQESTFRIFPIPLMNLFGTPFDWEHGHGGADPRQFLFDKALLDEGNDLAKLAWSYLGHQMDPKDERSVARILGLLNVKYVLVSYDIKENYFNIDKPSLLRSRSGLKSGEYDGIKFKRSFNKLHFYEVSEEYYLPKFYAPTTLTLVGIGNFSYGVNSQLISVAVPPALTSTNYDVRNAIFPAPLNPTIPKVFKTRESYEKTVAGGGGSILTIRTVTGFSPPVLEFKRISPTKYRVVVQNFTQPFLLILSENFNHGWKAYVRFYTAQQSHQEHRFRGRNQKGTIENQNLDDGPFYETWLSPPIPEDQHWNVNGYANGWWIAGAEGSGMEEPNRGGIEVILEFWPQRLFHLGFIISISTFLLFILYFTKKYFSHFKNGDLL
jgi:hypothetical protein